MVANFNRDRRIHRYSSHYGRRLSHKCQLRRWVFRTSHRHRVALGYQGSIPVAHGHRERVRHCLTCIQGLNGRRVLCECIGAGGDRHRQRTIGPNLAHRTVGGCLTNDPIGQRLNVHIGADQRATQACVGRRDRLIHLSNRSNSHHGQDRRVIRTSHRHRVGL